MPDPNEESIRSYERICRTGGPLRLLSIHCTIRQPSRHIKRKVSNSLTPPPKCSRKILGSEKGYEKPNQKINDSNASTKNEIQKNLELNAETLSKLYKDLPEIKRKSSIDINTVINSKFSKSPVQSLNVASPSISALASNTIFINPEPPKHPDKPFSVGAAFDSQSISLENTTNNSQCIEVESYKAEVEMSAQNCNNASCLKLNQTINFLAAKESEDCASSNNYIQGSIAYNSVKNHENFGLPIDLPSSLAPNINSSTCTPVRPSRFTATCISSANRSPFKGPTGSISQSPTIKLGKKIFHVPGSILLGAPDIIQNESKKKPQGRRSNKKDMDVSKCDLTLIDSSNPYDFVLGKRTAKVAPVPSSAHLVADMLLKPAPTQHFNILHDEDEEIDLEPSNIPASYCPAPYTKQLRTPLQVRNASNRIFSPSPLRNNSDKAETSPKKHAEEPLEDSLRLMFDLSQPTLPDLTDVGLLPELSKRILSETSEKDFSEPVVSNGLFQNLSVEMNDLFNASQESSDLQAILQNDLGYFNGDLDF